MKLIVNLETGQEEYVEETPEELADLAKLQATVAVEQATKDAELALITAKAQTDPAFAALVKYLGLQIPT